MTAFSPLFLSVILLSVSTQHSAKAQGSPPPVQCDAGVIQGGEETVTLHGGEQFQLYVYRGIPYAEAPTGDLRFAKPVPKARFTGPFSALSDGPACPQTNPKGNVMSEDCLNLNIYAPAMPNGPTEPKAVMVWIHGGKFFEGEGRRSPVWNLAAYGDIIIVTMNYRLGALGFLTTDDVEAPGNMGLWDQQLALKWVKDNIAAFGGDPNKITLQGSSIGGASVTYQAMYPPNNGLFQRVIVGSGDALSVPTYHTEGRLYAEELAGKVGCSTSSSSEMVECLRQVPFESIVANQDVTWQSAFDLPWTPVVDGDLIASAPVETVKWPQSSDLSLLRSVDAMFGTTSADGSISVNLWVDETAKTQGMSIKRGITESLFNQTIKDLLTMFGGTLNDDVKDAVYEEYFPFEDPDNIAAIGQSTIELTTDKHFFIPQVIFTRNHAVNNDDTNVYLFQFEEPRPDDKKGREWIKGCKHGHHIFFALGMPESRLGRPVDLSTERDAKAWELSKKFMTYFSNFVKSGDPNSPRTVPSEWEPFTMANEEYLFLDADVIETRDHCKAARTQFWLEKVPSM